MGLVIITYNTRKTEHIVFFHNYSLSHLHEYEIKCHMLGIFGINHVTRIKLWWKKNYNICSMYWCMDWESRLWIKDEWFLITDCTNHSSVDTDFYQVLTLKCGSWIRRIEFDQMLLLGRIAGDWTTLVLPDVVVDTGITEHKPVRGETTNHTAYGLQYFHTHSAQKKWNHKIYVSIPKFNVKNIITLFNLFHSVIWNLFFNFEI